MESRLVLADVLTDHEPGRDAFHRVPIFSGEFRDAVECVPTGLNGRFMGRDPGHTFPLTPTLSLNPVAADVSRRILRRGSQEMMAPADVGGYAPQA
jgi:hypothetical protein